MTPRTATGGDQRTATRLAPLITAALAASLLAPTGAAASEEAHRAIRQSTVFEQGEDGYHTFRIPAVVRAADGTLVAFAEARTSGSGDDGDIDLVAKRSTDGGARWGPLIVVWDAGANKAGNPVPVLDRNTGRLILNTTRTGGDVSTADVRCGRADAQQTRRSFVQHSDDDGLTWSPPEEITQDVRPGNWRHFVGGPGHAIQLEHGEHEGRLVIPGNHSVAPPEGSGIDCLDDRLFGAHSLYSDDGGATWHLGGVDTPLTGVDNPNESTVAERADGTVYFNARDQQGTSPATRLATTSSDGGASFDGPYQPVDDLVGPVVQGSVLALDGGERLLYAGPGRPDARRDLTLWTSEDATSWESALLVNSAPAGYSDLVGLERGAVGVLYENGVPSAEQPNPPAHQRITFARVPGPLLTGHGNDADHGAPGAGAPGHRP
ncbi:sialidase family protein [Streptomyces sp. SBT349]|uniref:sialidase family protein n=1 Tax=Streptomyces sp. SBT349 TaxID=1580539 RepID=UPI00069FF53C|nr:sialidase family protein [Streptomyces sp. SBT349]